MSRLEKGYVGGNFAAIDRAPKKARIIDYRKPDGLFVITPAMGPSFVEALPVERRAPR